MSPSLIQIALLQSRTSDQEDVFEAHTLIPDVCETVHVFVTKVVIAKDYNGLFGTCLES